MRFLYFLREGNGGAILGIVVCGRWGTRTWVTLTQKRGLNGDRGGFMWRKYVTRDITFFVKYKSQWVNKKNSSIEM